MDEQLQDQFAAVMTFDPLRAVALLLLKHEDRDPAFVGTCFAYRQPRCFVTAAHCVGNVSPSALQISTPFPFAREWQPESVEIHSEADIAVIRVADGGPTMIPFENHVSDGPAFGEEFAAFGFPEDIFGPEQRQPTPRLFRGHYQRLMHYTSPLGYQYWAGELSIAAPAGLSGGPVFQPALTTNLATMTTNLGTTNLVTGLVAENLASTTYLEAVEEVQTENRVTKTQYEEVVQYGVAVLLKPVEAWLDEHAPMP